MGVVKFWECHNFSRFAALESISSCFHYDLRFYTSDFSLLISYTSHENSLKGLARPYLDSGDVIIHIPQRLITHFVSKPYLFKRHTLLRWKNEDQRESHPGKFISA